MVIDSTQTICTVQHKITGPSAAVNQLKKVTDISRGSVATLFRCGGIFNKDFIENLL